MTRKQKLKQKEYLKELKKIKRRLCIVAGKLEEPMRSQSIQAATELHYACLELNTSLIS